MLTLEPLTARLVEDEESTSGAEQVRGIEIRGPIEIVPTGGSALGPGFDPELFRLRPKRIVSWGIDGTMMQQNARSVA
jgi:pyridoxamine 5'-phosphate oxidase family protein